MNKYLVSYCVDNGRTQFFSNSIVEWDCISQENIDDFELHHNRYTSKESFNTIIAITKLDR